MSTGLNLGQERELSPSFTQHSSLKRGYKNRLGRYGEHLAVQYLLKQGYYIWKRNWAIYSGELDIVAIQKHTLVFVEVKTRLKDSAPNFDPFEAVDDKKIEHIQKVSEAFIAKHHGEMHYKRLTSIRYDIIGVIISSHLHKLWLQKDNLIHYENAFHLDETV